MNIWSSIPIGKETIINSTNNTLIITLNGLTRNLPLEEVSYETSVIQHRSTLVDRINYLLNNLSINIKCKLGVIADGNDKKVYIIFVHNDADTFSYDGTFKAIIGEVQVFPSSI